MYSYIFNFYIQSVNKRTSQINEGFLTNFDIVWMNWLFTLNPLPVPEELIFSLFRSLSEVHRICVTTVEQVRSRNPNMNCDDSQGSSWIMTVKVWVTFIGIFALSINSFECLRYFKILPFIKFSWLVCRFGYWITYLFFSLVSWA